ncbi:hypothetical protein BH10ACT8_BH10ACT8_06370 [soil metagenome]|jgi:hypothetical protein
MTDDLFAGLFADAAMFPPNDRSVTEALLGHLRHRFAWYGDLIGPLVCLAGRVCSVHTVAERCGLGELAIAAVVPEGLAGVPDLLRAARRCALLQLASVEVPLGRHRLAEALTTLGPIAATGCRTYLELNFGQATERALHTLASTGIGVKVRVGGTSVDQFRDELMLAEMLVRCAAERVPFTCGAALHLATRHRDGDTFAEHHGYLNLALAARTAAATGSVAATGRVLAERDALMLATAVGQLADSDISAIRALFCSFASYDVEASIRDLVRLSLVTGP